MTSGIQSKGVDLDNIFAAYVSGTHPPATGIKVNGVDIANRYQPLPGTAAPATEIKTKGADLNTLFSTTSPGGPLPIDGNTYDNTVSVPAGQTLPSQIGFKTGGTSGNYTYAVFGNTSAGGTFNLATGSLPSTAASIQYTFGSYTVPIGLDGGGSTTNGAASKTSLTSLPQATYTTDPKGSSAGAFSREYPFTITIYDASNAVISTTHINLIGQVEGSA